VNINTFDAQINQAMEFVKSRFDQYTPNNLVYHNIDHTIEVFTNVTFLSAKLSLSEQDTFLTKICALFHDIGYLESYTNHEEHGIPHFVSFCEGIKLNQQTIDIGIAAILATEVPQKPYSNIDKVLCDADLMYLGSSDYFEKSELLRQEWNRSRSHQTSVLDFHQQSIQFFQMHHFHSEFGKKILGPEKERNFQLIKREIDILSKN